jgi:hypothetical protein
MLKMCILFDLLELIVHYEFVGMVVIKVKTSV